MSRISPTAEGFRATFKLPSLTFAEITWRWAVGATASALFLFGLVEYLRTLPVSSTELLFLRTRQPILVGQAIAHILRGSLNRVMFASMLAAIALAFLWMIAASLGRITTVRALLEYFAIRRDVAGNVSAVATADDAIKEAPPNFRFSSLLGLNFLRAALVLAAIFGLEGASILADFASPASNPQPGLAFFLFLPLAGLVCIAWSVLNWFLSLAAVFAVRDGEDTLGALSAAATLCRERTGPLFAVSTWTGLVHVAAFIGTAIAISFPLSLLAVLPGRLVIACMIFISLAYFAIADWLYTARLAGYVCILETPEALLAPPPLPPVPAPPPRAVLAPPTPAQTAIDRDEPILSDLPNLAVET